jgi:phage terminase Nu1 subunit (DNA packaging protein)
MPNKKIKSAQKSNESVSLNRLCQWTSLTDRRIRQFAEDGSIPNPTKKGSYNLDATLTGLFKYYRGRAEAQTGSMAAAKLRREEARAKMAEIEAQKLDESVILMTVAKQGFSRTAVYIKSKLLAIPSSVSPLLEGKSTVQREEILRAAVIDALQILSTHFLSKGKADSKTPAPGNK